MSGGNCPETPRQKLIGMMYLFLTAMLALNVSGELLNAFILVDNSILKTIDSVEKKNSLLYADFESANATNETKVSPKYNKALTIREEADSLFNHIQGIKTRMVQTVDGPEATPTNYKSKDNQDVAAQVMITAKGGERSKILKEKLIHFRDLLLGMVDESDSTLRETIERTLTPKNPPIKEGITRSWESEKFEHLPLSASIALMSQLQSEVRNMESDVIRYLFTKIDEGAFKFNSIEPMIIPRSHYVLRGDDYYAEIMMAARDTTQPPIVTVNGQRLHVEGGRGILKIPATSVGDKHWSGEIAVMGPDGIYRRHNISGEYLVSQPNVVISPVKMNVFYEGVENPVEVSVPGIPSENLNVQMSNVRFVKKGGQYIVTPNRGSAGRESIVSVSANVSNKTQSLGSQNFRIKRVPDPVAKVGGLREGKINKALLLAQGGVIAEMESFDFDLNFKVTRFSVSTVRSGYFVEENSESNLFTQAQRDLMQSVNRGGRVMIENIRATGPDGSIRKLGSINLTLD